MRRPADPHTHPGMIGIACHTHDGYAVHWHDRGGLSYTLADIGEVYRLVREDGTPAKPTVYTDEAKARTALKSTTGARLQRAYVQWESMN